MERHLFDAFTITNLLRILLAAFALAPSSVSANSSQLSNQFSPEFSRIEEEVLTADPSKLWTNERIVAKYLQQAPQSAEAHYLMSTVLLQAYLQNPGEVGLLRQSAALAAQAYELNPKSDLGFISLATVLDVSGENEKALQLISEAYKKLEKTSWRLAFAKGRVLASLDQHNEAMLEYERSAEETEAIQSAITPYMINSLIRSAASEKDLKVQLRSLEEKIPRSPDFSYALARLAFEASDTSQALISVQNLLERFPDHDLAKLLFVEIGLARKTPPKSLANILAKVNFKSLSQVSQNDFHRYALQVALREPSATSIDARFQKLLPSAQQLILTSNKQEESIVKLSKWLLEYMTPKETASFLVKLGEEVPGQAFLYAFAAELQHQKVGNHKDAIANYSRAITLDKTRSIYFNGRGLAFFADQNTDQAIMDFQAATVLDPSDASARYNYACGLVAKGQLEEALDVLSSALEIDPSLALTAVKDKDLKKISSFEEFRKLIERHQQDLMAH